MLTHETKIRVRYGETDQMGYLYYGNYAQYYEVGRAEMLRSLGLTYKDMEIEHGILMPVMSLNIRYVRPAYYDDLLTVKTTLRKLPDTFITFHMEVFNEAGELINGGSVKLSFVDTKSKKSKAAPPYLLERLAAFFE